MCKRSNCFSDNYRNYEPSMKNVQSFHVIRFLIKQIISAKGAFYSTYGAKRPGKMPPSLTKQFALNLNSKIRVYTQL